MFQLLLKAHNALNVYPARVSFQISACFLLVIEHFILALRFHLCKLKAIFASLLLSGSLGLISQSASCVFLCDLKPPDIPFIIYPPHISSPLLGFHSSLTFSCIPHFTSSSLYLIYTLPSPSFTFPYLVSSFLHLSLYRLIP